MLSKCCQSVWVWTSWKHSVKLPYWPTWRWHSPFMTELTNVYWYILWVLWAWYNQGLQQLFPLCLVLFQAVTCSSPLHWTCCRQERTPILNLFSRTASVDALSSKTFENTFWNEPSKWYISMQMKMWRYYTQSLPTDRHGTAEPSITIRPNF